uniref:Uncharacterized protein n=1 Tax=Oryza brachyantha TaxID=4533 RepID=J3N1Q0_ORYBR
MTYVFLLELSRKIWDVCIAAYISMVTVKSTTTFCEPMICAIKLDKNQRNLNKISGLSAAYFYTTPDRYRTMVAA